MLNAHKAACRTTAMFFETPLTLRRMLYRIRPGGQMAQFLGCACHKIAPLVHGIDDARPRVSGDCPIHGVHPNQVAAYV